MNRPLFIKCLLLVLVGLVAVSSGCRRKPNKLTYIPGHGRSVTNEVAGLLDDNTRVNPNDPSGRNVDPQTMDPNAPSPLPSRESRENYNDDREFFKTSTLFFDFDKAAVRRSELGKVQAVASALKARPETAVEIEGHCDERGTEEYNRSLGERRALSVRESLIHLGISSEKIYTKTFGEDKPAVASHSEAAWEKNRRAEFILLVPKK